MKLTVKLYDRAGLCTAQVPLPELHTPPKVILWDERCYALELDGEYRETTPFRPSDGGEGVEGY